MRAYIYVRFSTIEQAKGSSLERQLRDCRGMCDRMGWDRAESRELIDEGRSAYDGSNRAGDSALAEFERAVRAGEVPVGSVLVIERLDRISRQSPFEVFRLVSGLLEAGIVIGTASGDRVYTESLRFDQLIDMIVTAKLSNEESEKKSERLRAAWSQKRRAALDGKALTAMCPSWLRLDQGSGRYAVIDERADVVREVYGMAAAGRGKHLIAANLNARGVATFGGRGSGWHPSYVQKLLATRAVLGEFQPHRMEEGKRVPDGERLIGFFPSIVAPELFASAQAARSSRATMTGRRGPRIANLFSGLAKCAACGSTMTYRNKGKPDEQYLVCDGALRRRGCESRAYLKYSVIENAILDELLDLAVDDRRLPADDRISLLLQEQAAIADAISGLDARRKRLVDLLSRGEDPEIERLFRELGVELAEQHGCAEEAERRLVEAQGVPPEVHLSRVQAIRDAAASDDPAVCLPARAAAQQAIRHLIDRVDCDGIAEHITVLVLGGVHVFRFSREGETLVRSSDLAQLAGRPQSTAAHFASGDVPRERALLDVAMRAGRCRLQQGRNEASLAKLAPDLLERQTSL